MQKLVCHRLYTEDKNRQAIADIVAKYLIGFTIYTATGVWNGDPEQSLIIESIGAQYGDVVKVAMAIKDANKQGAVLYTAHEVKIRSF